MTAAVLTFILALLTENCHGLNWGYSSDDQFSPAKWSEFGDDNSCSGKWQSPIAIDTSSVVQSVLPVVDFRDYQRPIPTGKLILHNTGHTLKVEIQHGYAPQVSLYSVSWRLVEIVFHWGLTDVEGSEHEILGRRSPVEAQLICESRGEKGFRIFTVLFEKSEVGNKELDLLLEAYQYLQRSGSRVRSLKPISFWELLPKHKTTYYRYQGSLTTPPCTEDVVWHIFGEQMHVSEQQLLKLRSLLRVPEVLGNEDQTIAPNFRPTQPIGNRTVEYNGPISEPIGFFDPIVGAVANQNYSASHSSGVLRLATSLLQRVVDKSLRGNEDASDNSERANLEQMANYLNRELSKEERIEGSELGEAATKMKEAKDAITEMMRKKYINSIELNRLMYEMKQAVQKAKDTMESLKRSQELKSFSDQKINLKKQAFEQIAAAEAFRDGVTTTNTSVVGSGNTSEFNIGRETFVNLTSRFKRLAALKGEVQYYVDGGQKFTRSLLQRGQRPCPSLTRRQPKPLPNLRPTTPRPPVAFPSQSARVKVPETPAQPAELDQLLERAEPEGDCDEERPIEPIRQHITGGQAGFQETAERDISEAKRTEVEQLEPPSPTFLGLLDRDVLPLDAGAKRRRTANLPGLLRKITPGIDQVIRYDTVPSSPVVPPSQPRYVIKSPQLPWLGISTKPTDDEETIY